MGTTLQHHFVTDYTSTRTSIWKKFITWCIGQEKNRLGWLATAIMLHGCVLTIITMFAIITTGNHFIFWPFTIAAMGMTLVVNLAAMPTKITIPVFFLSILIDIVIITICLLNGFDMSATYV